MTTQDVLRELGEIEETVLVYPSTGGRRRARRMLTEMNTTQRRLVGLFAMDVLAPSA